jgi:2-phospho-L-lactate guanylyltransferase
VLACVGDLPALRSESIIKVLAAASTSGADRAFLSDASGVGTTMLIAHDTQLLPRFQGRSAAAHHTSGAINLASTALGAVPDAQRDVDTEVELQAAQALGLGPATSALVDHETGRLGRHQVITATQWRSPDGEQQAVTAAGRRIALPTGVLAEGLRKVRSGQRLHAVIAADDHVLSAWMM